MLALRLKGGANGVLDARLNTAIAPSPSRFTSVAAVGGDRRVLGGRHLAQQLQRRLVAGVERPGRELDDVGEQDRHVHLPATASLCLRQRLPRLQGARAPARARRSGRSG